MTADGLSTGLFVLGEDKALEVAEKNNLAVYLIIKTDNGFVTKSSLCFQKINRNKRIVMQTLFFTLIVLLQLLY